MSVHEKDAKGHLAQYPRHEHKNISYPIKSEHKTHPEDGTRALCIVHYTDSFVYYAYLLVCVYGTDADATAAAVVHFVHSFVGYCIFLQSNNMVYVVIGFYFLAYCILWPFARRKGNS